MEQIIAGDNTIKLNQRGRTWIKKAQLRKRLMSDDSVSMEIFSILPLPIGINNTIDIYGQTYRVNNPANITKLAEDQYLHSVTFEGRMFDLRRCRMRNADSNGFSNTEDFPLTGTIEIHLLCLINNMKRFDINWQLGTFENKETKTITYSKEDCLVALQRICDEFKVQFRVDEANGKSILNTGDFGRILPYAIEFGKGKGIYEIERTNVNENGIVNRLYVIGGNQNLPIGYRNYSPNLLFDGGFIQDQTSIDKIGLKEGFAEFQDIYPKRTGVISSIGSDVFTFSDSSMDFDLNEKKADGTTKYLIAGTSAKINFKTGNLAGITLDILSYDHSTKTFKVKQSIDEEINQSYPDPNIATFQFNVDDEYVLIDLMMPESYITNAENELLSAGNSEFPKNLNTKVNYRLKTRPEFWAKKVLNYAEHPFTIGDKLPIKDGKLKIDTVIPIVGYTRDLLLKEHSYDIDLADDFDVNFQSSTALVIKGVKNDITYQETTIKESFYNSVKRINELKNLVFDPSGDGITPRLETILMAIGGLSQQYKLTGMDVIPNYGDENSVKLDAGTLTHFSISDSEVSWDFIETIVNDLTPTSDYYVYGKCQKNGIQGEWYLTTDKLIYDAQPNDYNFLIGILHKVNNGQRAYSPLDGFSIFNGRYITAGQIKALDGQTIFDLDASVLDMGGTAGMTGKGSVNDIFFWGGSTYANRANARVWIKKNGHFRFKTDAGLELDSESNHFVGRYANGQIGMLLTMQNGNPEFAFYKPDGTKVYSLGQNGIYFVAEIPESYTLRRLAKLPSTSPLLQPSDLHNNIRAIMWQKTSNPKQFELRGNKTAYEYNAGRNVYSDANKQYEGLKNTQSYTDNIEDGWYVPEYLGWMMSDGVNETQVVVEVFYVSSGKISIQAMTNVETAGYNFNQF